MPTNRTVAYDNLSSNIVEYPSLLVAASAEVMIDFKYILPAYHVHVPGEGGDELADWRELDEGHILQLAIQLNLQH